MLYDYSVYHEYQCSVVAISDANVPTHFTRQTSPDAFLTPIISQKAVSYAEATSALHFFYSELLQDGV